MITTFIAELDGNDRSPTFGKALKFYRIIEGDQGVATACWCAQSQSWQPIPDLLTAWSRMSLPNRIELSPERAERLIVEMGGQISDLAQEIHAQPAALSAD